MKISEDVGSKYRFIILAGQRVSQLQKGADPRIEDGEKMKSTTLAIKELEAGKLDFKHLPPEGEEAAAKAEFDAS